MKEGTQLNQKRFRLPVMVAILATGHTGPALAVSPQAARSAIEAVLAKRAQARQAKDLNAYAATFTPDWETVNVAGRVVAYATLCRSTEASFASAHDQGVIQSHVVRVAVMGNGAQVTVATRYDYPVVRTPSGPLYRYKDTLASEIWVLGPAGWQEKREHYLVDNGSVSARPIPMARRRLPSP